MTPGQKREREIIIGEPREARWQMCLKGLTATYGHPTHPSLAAVVVTLRTRGAVQNQVGLPAASLPCN